MFRSPRLVVVFVALLLFVSPALLAQKLPEASGSLIKVTRLDPETGGSSRDGKSVLHVPDLFTQFFDGLSLVGLEVDVETGEIELIERKRKLPDSAGGVPQGELINDSFSALSATCADCTPIDCRVSPPPFPVSRTLVVVLDVLPPGVAHPPDWGAGNLTSTNFSLTSVVQVPDGTAALTSPPATTVTMTFTGEVTTCGKFALFFDMCQPDPAVPTLACP